MGGTFIGQGGLVREAVVVRGVNGLVIQSHGLGVLSGEGGDFGGDKAGLMFEILRADIGPSLQLFLVGDEGVPVARLFGWRRIGIQSGET